YGIQAKGLDGIEEPLDNMNDIAEYYTSTILDHNPHGPFAIAGYSFGGYVAIEIARKLESLGKEVKMVGIFDTNAKKTEFFKGSKLDRYLNKIRRQGLKAKWLANSLVKNPREIINYQARFFANQIERIADMMFSRKEVQTERV